MVIQKSKRMLEKLRQSQNQKNRALMEIVNFQAPNSKPKVRSRRRLNE